MAGPEQEWRDALASGKLMLQRDSASGKCFFPPRVTAPGGGGWDWVEASGRGTVHSASTVHPKPPAEPYTVLLVELEEGGRMMSRSSDALPIGTPVMARIDDGNVSFEAA